MGAARGELLRAAGHHLTKLGGDMIHCGVVVRVVYTKHAIARRAAIAGVVGSGAMGAELHYREIGWWLELLDRGEGSRADGFAFYVSVTGGVILRLQASAAAGGSCWCCCWHCHGDWLHGSGLIRSSRAT